MAPFGQFSFLSWPSWWWSSWWWPWPWPWPSWSSPWPKFFFSTFSPNHMNSRIMAKKNFFWSWWWWSWWWPWPSWWSSSWWSWQKWKLSERGRVWAQKYLAQWRKTCSSAKCPSRWFLLRESNGPGNGKLTKLGKYGVRKVENLFFSTFLELFHLLIGIDINIMFLKFILLRFRDMGHQSSRVWALLQCANRLFKTPGIIFLINCKFQTRMDDFRKWTEGTLALRF